jgi:hypothetical protein
LAFVTANSHQTGENLMSPATETFIKMVENLPLSPQGQIMVQVKHYLAEIQAENHWQNLYQQTESQLVQLAQQAGQPITEGQAEPMDFDKL